MFVLFAEGAIMKRLDSVPSGGGVGHPAANLVSVSYQATAVGRDPAGSKNNSARCGSVSS